MHDINFCYLLTALCMFFFLWGALSSFINYSIFLTFTFGLLHSKWYRVWWVMLAVKNLLYQI